MDLLQDCDKKKKHSSDLVGTDPLIPSRFVKLQQKYFDKEKQGTALQINKGTFMVKSKPFLREE